MQTNLSDLPVQARGLVSTDVKAKDIVLDHQSYCIKNVKERHVTADVLGYVTPVSQYFMYFALQLNILFLLCIPFFFLFLGHVHTRYVGTALVSPSARQGRKPCILWCLYTSLQCSGVYIETVVHAVFFQCSRLLCKLPQCNTTVWCCF